MDDTLGEYMGQRYAPLPAGYVTDGGLARLARAQNPEESIPMGAGKGGAFTVPVFVQPPANALDPKTAQLMGLLGALVQNHGRTLQSMYVDGEPVGKMLVEALGAPAQKR